MSSGPDGASCGAGERHANGPADLPPATKYGHWEGGEPVFLGDPVADAVVDICLELAAQLWVVKTRLHQLERAVQDSGGRVEELIESYQPSADEAWQAQRQAFVASVLRPIQRLEGLHGELREPISGAREG